jgi:release factor glutamine methyltransferase
MLIGDALAQAARRLRNDGVDSPRLDAELLLAHVLDSNRASVLTWPERRLTPKQLTRYRDLVARRAAREPLAYIVGHREFFGLDFLLDPRVLIPRPETELLVERALSIAGELRSATPQPEIADVGAGSGAITVTLAVRLPQATVYALDSSPGALQMTAQNALRHGVSDRVRCLEGDLLAPLPGPVDLIAANLPYVTTDEWQGLPPEIRDHEPRAALDGGPDGLTFIRRLLALAAPHLRPGGSILLEIGAGQGTAATGLARQGFPQAEVQLHQDYAGLDRLLVVRT